MLDGVCEKEIRHDPTQPTIDLVAQHPVLTRPSALKFSLSSTDSVSWSGCWRSKRSLVQTWETMSNEPQIGKETQIPHTSTLYFLFLGDTKKPVCFAELMCGTRNSEDPQRLVSTLFFLVVLWHLSTPTSLFDKVSIILRYFKPHVLINRSLKGVSLCFVMNYAVLTKHRWLRNNYIVQLKMTETF